MLGRKIEIEKNHKYFYQVQTQTYVAQKDFCDFEKNTH